MKRTAERTQKVQQALSMRAAGHTYEQIARALGLAHRSAAYHLIQRELERVTAGDVQALRREQHYALEELMRRLYCHLYTKKGVVNLRVVDRLLKCYDAEARLYGLYPKAGQNGTQAGGVKHVVLVREAKEEL